MSKIEKSEKGTKIGLIIYTISTIVAVFLFVSIKHHIPATGIEITRDLGRLLSVWFFVSVIAAMIFSFSKSSEIDKPLLSIIISLLIIINIIFGIVPSIIYLNHDTFEKFLNLILITVFPHVPVSYHNIKSWILIKSDDY